MTWARIEGEHHTGAFFCGTERGEGAWDAHGASAPSVAFAAEGDVRLYYHTFDREAGAFTVGMARSRDGMAWERDAPGCGAKIGAGAEGSFDERGAAYVQVVPNPAADDGSYLMFYEARDADWKASIGVAWSPDGINWRRGAAPVLEAADGAWDSAGVGMPCFVDVPGGTPRLYFTGWGADGTPHVGCAECTDVGPEGALAFERHEGASLTTLLP